MTRSEAIEEAKVAFHELTGREPVPSRSSSGWLYISDRTDLRRPNGLHDEIVLGGGVSNWPYPQRSFKYVKESRLTPQPPAPTSRRTLRFAAHVDDYAPGQAGPKTRKVSASKAKRIRAEHNQIHGYLTEMGSLRPGDEIKTSRDDLRSVLGAAAHMHFTATQELRPVTARLFVNQDVDDEVEGYLWDTFNVEIISITLEDA